MKFIDKIKFAFNDLINRKGRSLLTIIAVAIGALLLIVLLGVGDGVISKMQEIGKSFGDINTIIVYPQDASKTNETLTVAMGGEMSEDFKEVSDDETSDNEEKINKEDDESFKKISSSDIEAISKVNGVKKVYASISGNVTSYKLENGEYVDKSIKVIGENTTYEKDHGDELIAGSEISNKEEDLLIGENLLKRLGIDNNEDIIGKKITVKVEKPDIEGLKTKEPLEVTGIVKGVLDRQSFADSVVMDEKKAEPLVGYFENIDNYISEKGYTNVRATCNDDVKGTVLATDIQNKTGYACMSYSMFSDIFVAVGTIIKSILSIGGIIVLVVAGLGLVNTITMILQEKRKMIGVMRSVGGSRSNIRSIFLWQSIMIGISGCVLGAVLSSGGIVFANEFIIKNSGFVIFITPNNIAIAMVITFIISLIAGLVPASRAAKLNAVQAVAEE